MLRRSVLLLIMLWSTPVLAGEIIASGVTHEDNRYQLFLSARIDAAPERVYQTITDYPHLAAINPAFESSEVLYHSPERDRVRTRVRVCILVFCKTVLQVQDMRYPRPQVIRASMVPAAGDFRSGIAQWVLVPDGAGTRLLFNAWFVPEFWVPPVIGPWLIRRKLDQEVEVTMNHLEGNKDD